MSIDYTKHKDKRVNNPTMENRGFFVEEERKPYGVRYARDPSLDPQLVWKGKDEQDAEDLVVPAVPIYIQEKILPFAIIADLKNSANAQRPNASTPEGQLDLDLFADFNGLDSFEKEVEFYQHEKHWSNRMILGDSLLVMNSLAEKEGLKGKVQCIYIDPPYGIKFGSNWQVSTRKRDVKDGKAEDAAREPEVVRAFRDTWVQGIHSYLGYLRDRLRVAQELLTETGSIFVQIGDENVHLVRSVLDEVFGSENFISEINFAKTSGFSAEFINNVSDILLWYAKSRGACKFRSLFNEKVEGGAGAGKYRPVGSIKGASGLGHDSSRLGVSDQLTSQGASHTDQGFRFQGRTWTPPVGMHWKTTVAGLENLARAGRVFVEGNSIRYLRFLEDFQAFPYSNVWLDIGGIQSRTDPKIYVVQTATEAVKRCLLMTTDPGDLVLDPTCGSGTTATVAEQWGRRWITIDTSRVALALARTRLMTARFPYYLLADSPEGVKKEAELTGQVPPSYETTGDIRRGFVYERVPHVTLKSIANNPDIREGMTREEIDKAILKHAETEYLFDKPYQDNKRIRVTGPFTVESLSPHRTLPADDEKPQSESDAQLEDTANDFVGMVLENLRKAGVQNTKKGERLKFDDLQPAAGPWIHGTGTYTDASGAQKRVAISVGPEYGPITPVQVKEAAKEAVKGQGFDLLVICGYARDPHAGEESKQYGNLPILLTRINEDLRMGGDMLKKTGAGNLFMVFGEPDVDVRIEGGKVTVELKGLDVYDPTTGEIRSNSVDDIACWFIDTNYNEESFFVRHVYFVGAEITDKKDGQKYDPYRALRSTLKAEIDLDAWASIYSEKSRPFDIPETGKIAVKVINHYGDEVLKVYDLARK
jgi:adenine-specific DNA-methyltransferase